MMDDGDDGGHGESSTADTHHTHTLDHQVYMLYDDLAMMMTMMMMLLYIHATLQSSIRD